MLEVEEGLLKNIKVDYKSCDDCLREMLRAWLKRINPQPTWSAIITAIDDLGEHQLAEDLRKKYS